MISEKSRSNILGKLRSGAPQSQEEHSVVKEAYQPPTYDAPVEQLTRVLKAHHTSWEIISHWNALPERAANLLNWPTPQTLYAPEDERLTKLDWSSHGISLNHSSFTYDHQTAISIADVAIAETGTLVVTSNEHNATSHCFLAEHHIIVLEKSRLVENSEAAWERLNQTFTPLPRAVNFISGPSSSADVGLKLEYGAHGPRTLHAFIVEQ